MILGCIILGYDPQLFVSAILQYADQPLRTRLIGRKHLERSRVRQHPEAAWLLRRDDLRAVQRHRAAQLVAPEATAHIQRLGVRRYNIALPARARCARGGDDRGAFNAHTYCGHIIQQDLRLTLTHRVGARDPS